MKLENAFTVAAPANRVWETLLDLEQVARCLPGATLNSAGTDRNYTGELRVRLGPMSVTYRGTAQLTEIDTKAQTVILLIDGKETRGHGSASATITNRIIADGDATTVLVETDLVVTGRPAQFGRGIMQDVASATLAEFSRCLSEMISSTDTPQASSGAGNDTGGDRIRELRAPSFLAILRRLVRQRLSRVVGRSRESD